MDELKRIEALIEQLTSETAEIMDRNFPLNSRNFLLTEDLRKVRENDQKVSELMDQYTVKYRQLNPAEKTNYEYKNLLGIYNQKTRQSNGLIIVGEYSDEYELHDAFTRARKFGIEAIDKMYESSKNGNKAEYDKNKRILDVVKDILSVHFWGDSVKKQLDRYIKRLSNGRTEEDDIKDYHELVDKCKDMAFEYAKHLNVGADDDLITKYYYAFEEIFEQEKLLTEFMSPETYKEVKVNLHWIKVDAEKDAKKYIDDYKREQSKGITIKNMPVGKLFEFGNNRYVWKVLRSGGTRSANYLTTREEPSEYTEVFKVLGNGMFSCEWSGRLITNPGVYGENGLDINNCFSIFSYDMDTSATFKQAQDLVLAPEELQKKAIEQERRIVEYIKQRLAEQEARHM